MIKSKIIFFFFLIFFSNQVNIKADIVYIDLDYLIKNSKVGQFVDTEIIKIKKEQKKDFENKENDLRKKETELLAKKNILDEKSFNTEIANFKKSVKSYNEYKNKKLAQIQIKKVNSIKEIMKTVRLLLAEYSASKNISVILEKKNIIIAKTNLEITNDILLLLDKKINKIEIK